MKRIKLTEAKQKERFITTMKIAGLAVKTEYDKNGSSRGVHLYGQYGGNQAAAIPACCLNTADMTYSRDWDEGVEFCEKCWEITIGRHDIILFPKRVIHWVESHDDSAACGHQPGPVTTIFTDEVTCPDCRMTEKWKERYEHPGSRYANFNPYYVTEIHKGKLPEGSLNIKGEFTKHIFRSREMLENIPEKYFKLVRCPEAIDRARRELKHDPQAVRENWTYDPLWRIDRTILVEMTIQ